MSTSYVEYRGHGFWSYDDYLEQALALVAEEIGESLEEDWQVQLRDHWRSQSSGVYRSWIHPQLDEYITDNARTEKLIMWIRLVAGRNGISREVLEIVKLIESLVRGQLSTNEASPRDYMVT